MKILYKKGDWAVAAIEKVKTPSAGCNGHYAILHYPEPCSDVTTCLDPKHPQDRYCDHCHQKCPKDVVVAYKLLTMGK